jgi:hypothetical protein
MILKSGFVKVRRAAVKSEYRFGGRGGQKKQGFARLYPFDNEAVAERMFLTVYGSPVLQAAVGIEQSAKRPPREGKPELVACRSPGEAYRRTQVAHSQSSRPPRNRVRTGPTFWR